MFEAGSCIHRPTNGTIAQDTRPVGIISAAGLFLRIRFQHAKQLGNWLRELQSHGEELLTIRGHVQKQFPTCFDGFADDTWNMKMPSIAHRLPTLISKIKSVPGAGKTGRMDGASRIEGGRPRGGGAKVEHNLTATG